MAPSLIEPMRVDVAQIVGVMPVEERERLRAIPRDELILYHRSFGMGLRNAFRENRFPGLSAFCHAAVEESGEALSLDALSSIAIREIWDTLQKTA